MRVGHLRVVAQPGRRLIAVLGTRALVGSEPMLGTAGAVRRRAAHSVVVTLPALLALGCMTDFFNGPGVTESGGTPPPEFPKVAVSPMSATLSAVGATLTLSGVYYDSTGAPVSGLRMTWTSLNPGVATVSSTNGHMTAIASGQGTIAGEADTLTGYALVTVSAPQASPYIDWQPVASPDPDELRGVWGLSANDVYAVGKGGTVLHQGGTGWTSLATTVKENLNAAWGSSSGDVYVVGDGGRLLHYGGAGWTATKLGSSHLHGVWGTSPIEVFVVGDGGRIRRFERGAWVLMASGATKNLRAVWGTSSNDVYAVGDGGIVRHFDGTAWLGIATGTTKTLRAVWGSSPTDVFVAGDGGVVLHFNGTEWTPMPTPVSDGINGLWGTAGTEVYAITANGRVLRYNGTDWTVAANLGGGLRGIWGAYGARAYAVGNGGVIVRGSP